MWNRWEYMFLWHVSCRPWPLFSKIPKYFLWEDIWMITHTHSLLLHTHIQGRDLDLQDDILQVCVVVSNQLHVGNDLLSSSRMSSPILRRWYKCLKWVDVDYEIFNIVNQTIVVFVVSLSRIWKIQKFFLRHHLNWHFTPSLISFFLCFVLFSFIPLWVCENTFESTWVFV